MERFMASRLNRTELIERLREVEYRMDERLNNSRLEEKFE